MLDITWPKLYLLKHILPISFVYFTNFFLLVTMEVFFFFLKLVATSRIVFSEWFYPFTNKKKSMKITPLGGGIQSSHASQASQACPRTIFFHIKCLNPGWIFILIFKKMSGVLSTPLKNCSGILSQLADFSGVLSSRVLSSGVLSAIHFYVCWDTFMCNWYI